MIGCALEGSCCSVTRWRSCNNLNLLSPGKEPLKVLRKEVLIMKSIKLKSSKVWLVAEQIGDFSEERPVCAFEAGGGKESFVNLETLLIAIIVP